MLVEIIFIKLFVVEKNNHQFNKFYNKRYLKNILKNTLIK
jgi:hypothetical protein